VILRPYLGAEHIHQINRELYELEEEAGFKLAPAAAAEQKMESDADYAKVLQNLNRLRLAEIRQMIAKKKLKLTTKKETRRKNHAPAAPLSSTVSAPVPATVPASE
jgi:hypothetical protein